MAHPPQGFKVRLEPQDEFPHVPDAAANYNESMYFNVFDPIQKVGGWFRIGNRPNEGYAEMSVCLYLPGGRVGFMFGRPKISGNAEMNAGGLKIEVVEPFKRLKLTYRRQALPAGAAVRDGRSVQGLPQQPSCALQGRARLRGRQPDVRRRDGARRRQAARDRPGEVVRQAHYEQHVAAKGRFTVGEETLRDRRLTACATSRWGPRHWSAINWYRWCPMNFGRDFGDDALGGHRRGGPAAPGRHGVQGRRLRPDHRMHAWTPTGTRTATRPRCAPR